MKNLLKEVKGNIYGMGVYCFKDVEGKVLYVGSGMMNDRLQTHLYNLKRGLYENTNKKVLQHTYNCSNLIFEVLHYSENNSEYLNGNDKQRQAVQEALEVLEQFYVNMYKNTICNKFRKISKWSTSPNRMSTYKRRKANTGSKNPNLKYDERIIAEILWLKMNDYKPKQIEEMYKNIGIKANYIASIGVSKWIHLEPTKPNFIDKQKEVSSAKDTSGATVIAL
ncbi:hypothetical protein [Inediibacterium massiliense]|uniref:hypothetical protein n=1 Tax=Inediibacterium massiliense TaxID=1658111 RepID=UPI0006B552F4|nr:hypothetical protein [Inediibacterium massiliense]